MNRGRGGRDLFSDFGDPFAGFGNFGGFGSHRSLLSGFFGGRDPFDDPFFTQPFGGIFESSIFGSGASPFPDMHRAAFLEHQAPEPKRSRGPVIEELNSDDDNEDSDKEQKKLKGPIIEELDSDDEKANDGNLRKHGRSTKKPHVEDPNDEAEERKGKHLQHINNYNRFSSIKAPPQTQSFTFQSSSVTYGGSNGAYYTSSKTRRTGSDGLTFEESKEADSSTRQASHRVSRGLHNKGHTVSRKLTSDGRVDTMQTLHNLHQGELAGFEEAWKGNARQHLPGWTAGSGRFDNMGGGAGGRNEQAGRGGWALPSTQSTQKSGRMFSEAGERAGSSRAQPAKRSSNVRDMNSYQPRMRGE